MILIQIEPLDVTSVRGLDDPRVMFSSFTCELPGLWA